MANDKIEPMLPLASVVPAAVADLLRHAPLSPGKVTFAWRTAVGPALDRVTAVRLEHGVLIVETRTDAWAREVSRSSRVMLARVQALLGKAAVNRIDVELKAES